MNVALLFPGQGQLKPRMGLDFATSFSGARALLERASERTGVDVSRVLSRGGKDSFRTAVMQPTLTAIALGIVQLLYDAGVRARYVAGLSLGEVPAWSAAGCLDPMECVDVAAERGRLMEREGELRPGGMLAVDLGSEVEVERALELGRAHGTIALAAHSALDEWLFAGDDDALAAVARAYRSMRLNVSAAWHGPHMAGALSEARALFHAARRRPGHSGFIANRTGALVEDEAEIPELMALQLVSTVWWVRSMQTLAALGVTVYVTIGFGKVLRSLLRRTLGAGFEVWGTEDPKELEQTIGRLLR